MSSISLTSFLYVLLCQNCCRMGDFVYIGCVCSISWILKWLWNWLNDLILMDYNCLWFGVTNFRIGLSIVAIFLNQYHFIKNLLLYSHQMFKNYINNPSLKNTISISINKVIPCSSSFINGINKIPSFETFLLSRKKRMFPFNAEEEGSRLIDRPNEGLNISNHWT